MRIPIRVVLADDHHVVREAVASYIGQEADIDVVGQVATGKDVVQCVTEHEPDVLVLDMRMPDHKPVATAKWLHDHRPQVRIVAFTQYDRPEYVRGLIGAGASGYVLKDDKPAMLVQAIRAVAFGGEWFSPRVVGALAQSVRAETVLEDNALTDREVDVLRTLAETGKSNRDVGEALFLSEQTIKNHLTNIYRKIGVTNRLDAVLWAQNNGLVNSAETDDAV